MKRFNVLLSTAIILAVQGLAASQSFDAEPNNTCLTAQDLGGLLVPHTVSGSLDTPPAAADVEFFRFTATPGQRLQARLRGSPSGTGTLDDPYLGLFDSGCEVVDVNDDFMSLESRLDFMVPADGVFVLAATSCCDRDFAGVGGSSGTYELGIDLPPPPLGSISGTIVDAVSGVRVPGNQPPYARVDLERCDGIVCEEFVASESTDDQGRFTFDENSTFRILESGTYRIVAEAQDYQRTETDPFDVGPGAKIDIGEIAIEPPAITLFDAVACADLPPGGGVCSYTVRIRNNGRSLIRISTWSVVAGFSLGSPLDRTVFEASGRRSFRIRPSQSKTASFRFRVPGDVSDGATFCTDVYAGEDPNGAFRTLDQESLFCISKRGPTLTLVSEKEALAKLRGSQRTPRTLDKKTKK